MGLGMTSIADFAMKHLLFREPYQQTIEMRIFTRSATALNESSSLPRILTKAEMDLVFGGATGEGVATAFTTGGTTAVFSAVPGLTISVEKSGINPTGHGQITAGLVIP
jgi:hypothetical protein